MHAATPRRLMGMRPFLFPSTIARYLCTKPKFQ